MKGEAPTDPRGVFKQRSRWCKGQIQVRALVVLQLREPCAIGSEPCRAAITTKRAAALASLPVFCRNGSRSMCRVLLGGLICAVFVSRLLNRHDRCSAAAAHCRLTVCRLAFVCTSQILFDKQHTPMFDTGLTLGMRLLYTSGEHKQCQSV